MRKIKKGDTVIVIKGKDRGRQGVVSKVVSKSGLALKVLVEGINMIKRHVKPTQQKAGGIIDRESPLAISNVAIFNAATGKADRVGFKMLEDGRKARIFKSTGEVIDLGEKA